jgi:hypothetical protein
LTKNSPELFRTDIALIEVSWLKVVSKLKQPEIVHLIVLQILFARLIVVGTIFMINTQYLVLTFDRKDFIFGQVCERFNVFNCWIH